MYISNKHLIYMNVAKEISNLATCAFTKVGVLILTKDLKPISHGYNGVPSKMKHCCDMDMTRDEHKLFAEKYEVHAEMNAILQVENTSKLKDSVIFTTLHPCENCLKHISSVGIKTVFYDSKYWRMTDEEMNKLHEQYSNIEFIHLHSNIGDKYGKYETM